MEKYGNYKQIAAGKREYKVTRWISRRKKRLARGKTARKRRFLSKKRDFNEKHPQSHGFVGVFMV
ncbi:MAG: hypothetical protein IKA46_03105 [Clostridia bacterium]|nr:hypothetical protein [Clostridia bacterium]MBR3862200.1 hypothetical protein [Clostridia bacterium]